MPLRKNIVGLNRIEIHRHLGAKQDCYQLGIFGVWEGSPRGREVLERFSPRCQEFLVLERQSREGRLSGREGWLTNFDLDATTFISAFRSIVSQWAEERQWSKLDVLLDVSEIPRVFVGSILGFLHSARAYKTLTIVYESAEYLIDGVSAFHKYKDVVFAQRAIERLGSFVAIPYISGRYRSSSKRHIMMTCGLDARLVVPRVRALEPYTLDLILPMVAKNDEFLESLDIANKQGGTTSVTHIDHLGLFDLLDALRGWKERERSDDGILPQSLLFSVGWKTHHVISCLWSIAESECPVMTTSEDVVIDLTIKPRGEFVTIVVSNIAAS